MPEEKKEQEKQDTEQKNQEEPVTWNKWLEGQAEDVRKLYGEHISGLTNTVAATRKERDAFAKELRDATGKLEKGSEAEKRLSELAEKLELTEKRATFLEEAVKPEIGCRNPKAAYALAVAEDLFSRNGAPDWRAIREVAPELFGKSSSSTANAGNGTDEKMRPGASMDDIIRARIK